MKKESGQFAFGKNWKKFIANNKILEVSRQSEKYLADFLLPLSIQNKSFIDVGCGSGVHSLAAKNLGVANILSVDIDQDSVDCCLSLKDQFGQEADWEVKKASILDLSSIGNRQFDIVYCWGVAHHTGKMWQALANLGELVAHGGVLYLAIYNKVEGRLGSQLWLKIKLFYHQGGTLVKKLMEWLYLFGCFCKLVIHLKNPFKVIRHYQRKRGMSWKTDLIDWVGGYPYEYASAGEIVDFYYKDFYLLRLKTTNYLGCNQFLFIKK